MIKSEFSKFSNTYYPLIFEFQAIFPPKSTIIKFDLQKVGIAAVFFFELPKYYQKVEMWFKFVTF